LGGRRESYKVIVREPALSRLAKGECPACGKPKTEWNRRIDWTCCSKECTEEYYSSLLKTVSWDDLRSKVLHRDDYVCAMCGCKHDPSSLVADHIVPVALGGDQWDLDNIQTLCVGCHRFKTRLDISLIARVRRTLMHRDRVPKTVNMSLDRWIYAQNEGGS